MKDLESKMDRVVSDISDIKSSVARLEVHVEKNTESLEYHIKRTDLNEERIDKLEAKKHMYEGAGLAIKFILTLVVLPIAIHFIKTLIK